MTNLRKPVPDLMKGIAVVVMIQVHIMELFARQEILSGFTGKISLFFGGPFAAPVFMAVMGYFVACSTRGGGDKMKRGLLLILLGFFLNIGLNLHLLIKIFNGTFNLNPLEYIFGADILFLAGFSVIFISILEALTLSRLSLIFIIAALFPLFSPFLPDLPSELKYLQAFFYGKYSWSYFPVFPWMAYSLLGCGFRKIESDYPGALNRLMSLIIPLIILTGLILAILFAPAFKQIIHLPSYYHHDIFLFTWIVCFLVAFTWMAWQLDLVYGNSTVFQFFKWLGKNVTVIYVVQWLIIGNIATAIYRTQAGWALMLWFLAILAGTSLISFFYVRLRNRG